jgi:hypothetical protein
MIINKTVIKFISSFLAILIFTFAMIYFISNNLDSDAEIAQTKNKSLIENTNY